MSNHDGCLMVHPVIIMRDGEWENINHGVGEGRVDSFLVSYRYESDLRAIAVA
jgi:hypothetical protein